MAAGWPAAGAASRRLKASVVRGLRLPAYAQGAAIAKLFLQLRERPLLDANVIQREGLDDFLVAVHGVDAAPLALRLVGTGDAYSDVSYRGLLLP